jgi:hypothetical protein
MSSCAVIALLETWRARGVLCEETADTDRCRKVVTGQRSNQLNYVATCQINKMRNRQRLCGVARFAYRAWNCLCCLKERDSCPNRPQTASNFRLPPAPVPCEHPLAQTALGDPDCSQPGRNPQRTLSKSLAQKYPNSFSQNTEERRAVRYFFDESKLKTRGTGHSLGSQTIT